MSAFSRASRRATATHTVPTQTVPTQPAPTQPVPTHTVPTQTAPATRVPAPSDVEPRRRTIARLALGGFLAFAGTSHLTWSRREFQAQVPPWVPVDADAVVIGSGLVEVVLGTALITVGRSRRAMVGGLAGAFFVAVFPGNVSQFLTRTDAFGLDTDRARATRLAFQPALVAWALWSTGAGKALREARRSRTR